MRAQDKDTNPVQTVVLMLMSLLILLISRIEENVCRKVEQLDFQFALAMPMNMYIYPIANQAAGLFQNASKERPLFDQNNCKRLPSHCSRAGLLQDHLFFSFLVGCRHHNIGSQSETEQNWSFLWNFIDSRFQLAYLHDTIC